MIILSFRSGHDASACIVKDGKILVDISEERLSRVKNDSSFPLKSINFCLDYLNLKSTDIDYIAYPSNGVSYEIPLFFEISNLNKNYIDSFSKIKRNLFSKKPLIKLPIYIKKLKLKKNCQIIHVNHHLSHISAAYFTSININTKKNTLGLVMDGAGDNESITIWDIKDKDFKKLKSFNTKASLGWFYANCTEAMGWRHGSDEWKLMGLAPYGNTGKINLEKFLPNFKNGELLKQFNYSKHYRFNENGANHYHSQDTYDLINIKKNIKDEDFAAEVQNTTEKQALNLILPFAKRHGYKNIICSGGFFLNVKLNQRIWESGLFNFHSIYSNPGDSGLPAGAALYLSHNLNKNLSITPSYHTYYGPEFTNNEIKRILDHRGIKYKFIKDIAKTTAQLLFKNLVVGWFQGRMESGPRALGNRSILMSPLKKTNKDLINSKIKYREKFRPFCPSILESNYFDYIENGREELFMVSSFKVKNNKKRKIPAVVHVDDTLRPHMVKKEINPKYYSLISEFKKLSGEAVLLNTSFNIKGEPIVCNPREAIKCFFDTGMDALVLGNYLILKSS